VRRWEEGLEPTSRITGHGDGRRLRVTESGADDGTRAALLEVPISTVLEWGRNGTLPRVKLGRHRRFIRAHVEAAILDREPAAANKPSVTC
jgi:excisionase family DNA binding protein